MLCRTTVVELMEHRETKPGKPEPARGRRDRRRKAETMPLLFVFPLNISGGGIFVRFPLTFFLAGVQYDHTMKTIFNPTTIIGPISVQFAKVENDHQGGYNETPTTIRGSCGPCFAHATRLCRAVDRDHPAGFCRWGFSSEYVFLWDWRRRWFASHQSRTGVRPQ